MPDGLKERGLKITEALYRTTDLFSDAEPLKWALRETALDILSAEPRDAARLEALIRDIIVKLELAASGTFISKMNFDVLRREYSGLLQEAMSIRDNYQNLLDNILSDKQNKQKQEEEQELQETKITQKPEMMITDRRGALLNALRQRGPSSVGDIAKALGGLIGEKTVQRELSAMAASGAVRQEGEKRWRRYFI